MDPKQICKIIDILADSSNDELVEYGLREFSRKMKKMLLSREISPPVLLGEVLKPRLDGMRDYAKRTGYRASHSRDVIDTARAFAGQDKL